MTVSVPMKAHAGWRTDYFYKAAIFGVTMTSALQNVPYAFWAKDNKALKNEVPAEQKSKAEEIYALSVASASVNGLVTLSSLPLFWRAMKNEPYEKWHTSKAASFGIVFFEGCYIHCFMRAKVTKTRG